MREEWRHSRQGKKVLDGRCGQPDEAKPVPGQTCPIETAPGELQDIEAKETRPRRPGPEPLLFRDTGWWDQSRPLRRRRSRQAAPLQRALFARSRAHDERCREQSAEAHNHRPDRPPLVSQLRQSYASGIRWKPAAGGPRYPAT